ncbi:MAG: helix-turn-helix transcriptional regulator [Chitinophagaceae bacterium]|nr:helix-turn-helix transcriptional regulator [Chitinophagaceae bacterium]
MKKKNLFYYLRSWFGEKKKNKTIELHMSNESIEELKSRLKVLMTTKQPFLQKGYHMKDMAEDLNIPIYQLSAFINQVMGVRFTDYMNKFRIIYCEELLRKSDENEKVNFQYLADKCGFNNRNSFASAFKKFTGKSPSIYLKHLQ